jgi:Ca-activated chloride channel family protein
MLVTPPATAKQVRLEVSLDKPTLLAAKKQTTFIKVGLTGFKNDGNKERSPVNVAIVLDKSGSMSGQKIDKAKEAAIAAIQRLNKNDIVSVVAYDSTVTVVVPATKLTDKRALIERIRRITAGGSTALFAGVSKGAAEIRKFAEKNRVNRVILLSDGLANVGPKSPSELGALGASLMKEGIAVSTMGLGLDYNEDLMTKLAQNSGGNHVFIENADALVGVFNNEFNDVLSVVAQEVSINIKTAKGIRPVRVLNSPSEINGQTVIVSMNQIYSEQEKYILLEVEVPASKAGQTREIAEVKVSYANMQTKTTDRLSSSVSANFSDSVAVVEKNLNILVCTDCVLQLANEQNILATSLRDLGDVAGARRILLLNSKFLKVNGAKYNSSTLLIRGDDNSAQALTLDTADWKRSRKQMRYLQNLDAIQQATGSPKKR